MEHKKKRKQQNSEQPETPSRWPVIHLSIEHLQVSLLSAALECPALPTLQAQQLEARSQVPHVQLWSAAEMGTWDSTLQA